MPALADVIAAVERWYDPSWAESWDAVGLVCGDPSTDVRRIVLAVDVVPATVAAAEGAQLLLTHHPLFLTAVHGVPITDPKGALVHRMIRSDLALYVAHSNAEIGWSGVSDALAATLGVEDVVALEPTSAPGTCRDRADRIARRRHDLGGIHRSRGRPAPGDGRRRADGR